MWSANYSMYCFCQRLNSEILCPRRYWIFCTDDSYARISKKKKEILFGLAIGVCDTGRVYVAAGGNASSHGTADHRVAGEAPQLSSTTGTHDEDQLLTRPRIIRWQRRSHVARRHRIVWQQKHQTWQHLSSLGRQATYHRCAHTITMR